MRKTRKPFARSFEQHLDPVSVHDVGRMDLRLEQKAFRIDQDVAFSALDLLATIIASLLSSHAGALDRLRIDNTRGGLRITPKTDPQTLADGCVEPLPGTIDAPEPKVMVDGLITNDKFCFSRHSKLKLKPKRRGYRPRVDVELGGTRGARVDRPTHDGGPKRRCPPVGSSLPAPPRMGGTTERRRSKGGNDG